MFPAFFFCCCTLLLLQYRLWRVGADDPSTEAISVRGNPNYDGRALTVPMDREAGLRLYQHWMDQAFSGLFAAVANKKIENAPKNVRDEMGICSKQVTDVISHAQCLSRLLRGDFEKKNNQKFLPKNFGENREGLIVEETAKKMEIGYRRNSRLERYKKLEAKNNRRQNSPNLMKNQKRKGVKMTEIFTKKLHQKMPTIFADERHQQYQPFRKMRRAKRQSSKNAKKFRVKTAPKYALRERRPQQSPLGTVAQLLTKALLGAKNKTELTEWQTTIEQIRRSSAHKKAARKRKNGANLAKFMPADDRKIEELDEVIERGNRSEIRQIMRKAQRQKMGNKMGGDKMDPNRLIELIRQAVTIGFALAGENTTGWDDKTMRLVSPRFFSVVAEDEMAPQNETLNLLSPSLFSMHDDGQGLERAVSLPALLRHLSLRDQQHWLNLIMEAAGINEQAKKLLNDAEKEENDDKNLIKMLAYNATEEGKENDPKNGKNNFKNSPMEMWKKTRGVYEKEIRGEDGQPMYFTKENVTERFGDYEKRKIQRWEQFMGTFSQEQNAEMNRTGFAPMRPEQLQIVYGKTSPFNDSEALQRLTALNEKEIRHGIERDIHMIAKLKSWKLQHKDSARRRRRAVVLSPIVSAPFVLAAPVLNQAVVLSPVVLSPVILTPAVLGPFILSPWVFVPVILSPRVLSPFILNPFIFSPIVLSPLVLHPLILSPGVFNPIVLSPLVLSPFILSPQVFTPVILSPLVLNPLILTPMVGSPLVLSPFVLSPLIFSPQALFALVLSPYALSPLIESKLFASALVLSPSFLS